LPLAGGVLHRQAPAVPDRPGLLVQGHPLAAGGRGCALVFWVLCFRFDFCATFARASPRCWRPRVRLQYRCFWQHLGHCSCCWPAVFVREQGVQLRLMSMSASARQVAHCRRRRCFYRCLGRPSTGRFSTPPACPALWLLRRCGRPGGRRPAAGHAGGAAGCAGQVRILNVCFSLQSAYFPTSRFKACRRSIATVCSAKQASCRPF